MKFTTHFALQSRGTWLLDGTPCTEDCRWNTGLSPSLMLFPINLHLRLRWRYISRLQFKARGPNFHAELIPVHSPLLRESYLVSYPPLTYMLKFSGFADLTSCLECDQLETEVYQACDQQQSNVWHRSVIQIACCGQYLCTGCVKGKLLDTQTRTHDSTNRIGKRQWHEYQ